MKYVGQIVLLTLIVFCSALQAAWAAPQPPDQPRRHTRSKETVLVGRVSVLEGEMLRYVHEQKDWVPTVKDSPFGREDALYLGENSRAEFLMPNETWIRAGANTQIQMIALKEDLTEVDVAAGIARFINRSRKAVAKATTPYGYATGAPGSIFDVYVGDESVEIVAVKGKVEFVHDVDGAKYNVIPRSMSILADNRQAAAGEGKVVAGWDDWNIARDSVLVRSIETRGESVNHLPVGIREDSAVLDEYGRWDRVYYEGEYREAWRPTSVEEGWSPYTVGHWTDWYGDYTWVPYEPFGYVTHHYGYWFRTNECWYWSPPVASAGWESPYWGIGFGWYPGRVGWVYSDASIGWFPLLPWEPYYAFNWWGPWGFAVHHAGLIGTNFNRYSQWDRAVIINQGNFHNVTSYSRTRLSNINGRTISSGYRAAPVVSNSILGNAGDPGRRFSYTNATARFQPGRNVTSRVARNQAKFQSSAAAVNGSAVRGQVAGARLAKPALRGNVTSPKIASGAARTRALGAGGGAHRSSRAGVAKSGQARAVQSRHGHGPSAKAGGGAGTAGATGRRANRGMSAQGHGSTAQNGNLRQGGRGPSSGGALSTRQGHAVDRGVSRGAGGALRGRSQGSHRSPGGMGGRGGSRPGGGGGRAGGGGHAGGGGPGRR
ncbi:MAG: DUF6600 domain-containing protein [Syntrophobacteraceae bacterium]